MIEVKLDSKKSLNVVDLSISYALEECIRREIELLDASVISDLEPKYLLVVAIMSEAKESLVSKYNKLKSYYEEQSGIFKCTALMWSTLSHHNSRGGLKLNNILFINN
ncbi:TPA: hypothetical protein ACMDRZ_003820 [Vibrio cholerae]|uniref:Uncharacterized protein n=1 Tax=Vibrio xiamenensis TaxID=861298 RepID=A0A1G8HHF9_9VIBR|nr:MULTISPECIES: hypothetical protein [Vibrio]EHD2271167.1 hypothetical protein [Vibrio cholerae]EIC2299259.1 hypothetical protein [Vibrio cholerae]EIJ2221413.1 hypothetical protein [Vibrio cholerae]EJL6912903.1 hypothetical protein [Vibrio cholerae]EJL6998746.1 hypothetical protein [Vibrio cholerae]